MFSSNNLRVLILGGAGFIGKSLSISLATRGHTVRILDNLTSQVHGDIPINLDWIPLNSIEFIRGSILDKKLLVDSLNGVDVVVHLAAETGTGQSMYDVYHYNHINSLGTALLMDVLVNNPNRSVKRVVLSSSRSVYGEGAYCCSSCNPGLRIYPDSRKLNELQTHVWDPICTSCSSMLTALPTNEDDKVNPGSIYASTKFAQEDLVRISCKAMNVDYAILRLQNVYGEGQSLNNPYTGILSIFSTRIRRGLSLPIFEDGLVSRDFVHIIDVVSAFVSAIEETFSIQSVINVGSGIKSSIFSVAQALVNAFGKSNQLVITENFRVGDIRHNYADINRLSSILHVTPRIDLQDGLSRFVDWAKAQPLADDKLDSANDELRSRRLLQ